MAVAVRLGMRAVVQIAGQMRAHQDHRHVEHRHIDVLAPAGALALEQRRGERKRAGGSGGVIDHRTAELDRMYVLGSGHGHDAGGRLDHVIVSRLRAARPLLSERRERSVDQPRIDRGQRLIAEPERLEGARAIVLDEYVRGGRQLF